MSPTVHWALDTYKYPPPPHRNAQTVYVSGAALITGSRIRKYSSWTLFRRGAPDGYGSASSPSIRPGTECQDRGTSPIS